MNDCKHEKVRVGEIEVNAKGLLTGRVGLKCRDCGRIWTPAEAAKERVPLPTRVRRS